MNTFNEYNKSPQKPLASGFGKETTAQEALGKRDLSGKIAIVTGGYSGIGLETTRILAEAGATVIVPVRTPEKAAAALAGIPRVELELMDLMNPASIDDFAQRFLNSERKLDILLNSAGIMAVPHLRDARGFESHFATNHLGHFQLTARLWPALKASGNARVVSVSSRAHRISGVDFDDVNFEKREYNRQIAYGQSKSANALFAVTLDRIGQPHGVRAFSVHPGMIVTELWRHLTDDELRYLGALDEQDRRVTLDKNGVFKTVEQGAATSVWCAANTQLDGKGGVYCEDVDITIDIPVNPSDALDSSGIVSWASDPSIAERLWLLSEEMTGVKFEN
ncbi:SDR family NAD(P)-dependent oxidoreductase [Paenibacillus psychroresistens]|uniref:Probable oxidoreductase n=1 Tax=Paenibacillus psychroresistens TaxID=1778678 RepID=A0A6B8RJU8_9BACL|nr:SDR family NAD(P)-dependent oxidoreductase [Paenibacillus psychroresistens]QGQ96550.1 SDR family NAD(P)-dependent oxidoreductase [Paenibacillus psychroresistens]